MRAGGGDLNCLYYLANDEFFKDFRISKQMFRGAEGVRINGTLGIR